LFPFTHQFSDQEYAKLYNNELVVSKLANHFAFFWPFSIPALVYLALRLLRRGSATRKSVFESTGATIADIVRQLCADSLNP